MVSCLSSRVTRRCDVSNIIIKSEKTLFTTWARFPLFSQGINFAIPRSLSLCKKLVAALIVTGKAYAFLEVLNSKHPAVNFTMELATNNKVTFFGMNIIKNGAKLVTSVSKKPTNSGLLLHFDSHGDQRCKKGPSSV